MGYMLCEDVSFCVIDDRSIFLDLRHDRYFCLGELAQISFERLVSGAPLAPSDRRVLETLASAGFLSDDGGDALPEACTAPTPATISLLDVNDAHIGARHIALALACLAKSGVALRTRKLQWVIRDLRRRKAQNTADAGDALSRVAEVASAFHRSALLTSPHDQCLRRSIAMARRLLGLGLRPDLVFGVKLHPFKAHCWVQQGEWLVNDRPDAIRNFTPILVV